ncbi:MAG TPA: hypothetical protein VEA69_12350 [Tepidisphaeraceae bacterium]|nr:hypothetical protein [Tepidisphaeraceae bacterium]
MGIATLEILKRFCAKEDGRYAMSEPFAKGGYTYATDGHIAVRVPTPDVADTGPTDGAKPVDAASMFQRFGGDATTPWPAADYHCAEGECETCEGAGRVNRTPCDVCHGTGEHRCHDCGDVHDCRRCEGGSVGGDPCPECHGVRRVVAPRRLCVGGVWVAVKYDRMIRSLGEVTYAVAKPADLQQPMVRFRWPGGEGLVTGIGVSKVTR